MVHDPLSPSEALRTRSGAVVAVVGAFVFGYSVLVLQQLQFGVRVGLVFPAGLYLVYRTFAVLDSIADAAQRFAAVREREESSAGRAGEREP